MGSNCKQLLWKVWSFKDIIALLTIPLLCLPLIIVIPTPESYCGYVLIVMSLYWIFECVHISVTSLIPLVLFPTFGILEGGATASMYFKDITVLIFGATCMALAIEHWNLHRRIALSVLVVSGTKLRWLLLSFMLITWFLSAWMSNTATTAMMLPLAQSVLARLSEIKTSEMPSNSHQNKKDSCDNSEIGDVITNVHQETSEKRPSRLNRKVSKTTPENEPIGLQVAEEYRLFGKALTLAICYSASIGGTATLIGSSPQLILYGQMNDWAELSVLTMFVSLCLLWISRNIGGYGWTMLFPEDYVTDATPAIFMAFVLFCFPSEFPGFFRLRTKEDTPPTTPKPSLLNWQVVHKKMPWSLFLLIGGGYALAEGMEVTGLSRWIGDQLSSLGFLSDWTIVLICSTLACFFTEVTSNTAVATIFLPIIGPLAESICLSPLYVLMPCYILISYAFMLPVATAPNAMAFANGLLTIPDMAFTGLGLSILGIAWINLWVNSVGNVLFDLDEYPDWAKTDNTTCFDTTMNISLKFVDKMSSQL
ncbi:solute carrier family 13 member 2-like [Saccoglossus kowalevskii]|uniref:Solute carrier family 13 member 2-like n=1 Tax=Saccoglossus kowalevskii TaxID=10224 RepID=A0ABM0MM72_SACKO|nr:PREDICTED: solute carrier family 13 member 2-like [Saccoglossus kowalevskii]